MKRKANIEVLRILAMLMVVVLHALGHGGLLNYYNYGEFGYFIVWFVESVCFVAVNCFVLITGYFMVKSTVKPSKILKLILQVWFFSILCTVLSSVVFQKPIGLKALALAVFPLSGNQYWFATDYVVLLALTPILNKVIHAMNKKELLGMIFILIVVFSLIPTVFFWSRSTLGSGHDFVWFVVLYFTAAYIQLYGISCSAKRCAWLYIGFALLGYVSNKINRLYK